MFDSEYDDFFQGYPKNSGLKLASSNSQTLEPWNRNLSGQQQKRGPLTNRSVFTFKANASKNYSVYMQSRFEQIKERNNMKFPIPVSNLTFLLSSQSAKHKKCKQSFTQSRSNYRENAGNKKQLASPRSQEQYEFYAEQNKRFTPTLNQTALLKRREDYANRLKQLITKRERSIASSHISRAELYKKINESQKQRDGDFSSDESFLNSSETFRAKGSRKSKKNCSLGLRKIMTSQFSRQ